MTRILVLLFAWLPLLALGADEAPAFQEGKDYRPALHPSEEKAKSIRVEEFFWYGCPHCYALEPALEDWVKKLPKDVEFVRVPNSLGRDVGVLHSKTYYAAASMNLLDKVHRPIFDALHADPGSLTSAETISAFVAKTSGVSAEEFAGTLNSFFIDGQARTADQHAMEYGVSGTPTLVVDGRYLINATQPAEKMLKVADFVVQKVRKERKKK